MAAQKLAPRARSAFATNTVAETRGTDDGIFRHRRDRIHRQAASQKAVEAPRRDRAFPVTEASRDKLAALHEYWGASEQRAQPVVGDLAQPKLGLPPAAIRELKSRIDHFSTSRRSMT